jgi:DNA-binding CsgD family transcriptional regulator/tetratricopeptide (TPR) repeat protein
MTVEPGRRGQRLINRISERDALDDLVRAIQAGESRALVIRGDPGIGKTVLLEYLLGRATGAGYRLASATGMQSEMELAFAGLHQLCVPILGYAERVPKPQRDALRTAFGLSAGPPPDRFFVGLAVLSLLSEVAGERPLICLIDDEQWLDQASAQALGFVARRLWADPIGLVFAARQTGVELAGLPVLEVDGLHEQDAHALLESAVAGPLDARIADLIVAETRGNPLALLELPRGLSRAELAGGFGLPGLAPLAGRIEESFTRQMLALPAQTRQLVLVAAADPSGDRSLVWRAAARLGIPLDAATPAMDAGLVDFDARVRFRHPLARSAAYRSAPLSERRQIHAALAAATDPNTDPDRRAWHRAQATPGPDEDVAIELEQSARRAQARGGVAAAAAFLERSVALTADPTRHSERILGAAQANFQAGAFKKALDLLAIAETLPLAPSQQVQVEWLRAHVAFASRPTSDAAQMLLDVATRLESSDLELARETYLAAYGAAGLAGPAPGRDTFREVCRAIRALPPRPGPPRPFDLLLDGLALLGTGGYSLGAATLQRAARALTDISVEEVLRWGWMATSAAAAVWDFESLAAITARQVQLVRDVGALAQLPLYLAQVGMTGAWLGDFEGAAAAAAESDSIAAATGTVLAPFTLTRLAALGGREADATAIIATALEYSAAGGQGIAAFWAHWASAVLYNGLARYEEAARAARQATSGNILPYLPLWALPELVEASARAGDTEAAHDALARLAEMAQACGTDAPLGVAARCRALLSDGDTAEDLYGESIARLTRTPLRPELARAHLLYGEWLRRAGRRLEARDQLRTAHDEFVAIGMEAFADRARRELLATGMTPRKRTVEARNDLTPTEVQIASLARDGLSNSEIASQLFLSPRTVEWHLRRVFTKLGISRRGQLVGVLRDEAR